MTELYTAVFLFLIGASLGSLSLVIAWRLKTGENWVSGRSKCDSCNHILEWQDLLPIASYLFLRGKCRYCHKKLPKSLIFAELLFGLSLMLSYIYWPFGLSSVLEYLLFFNWVLVLVLMMVLFWYDLRWYLLPNKVVYPLIYSSITFMIIKYFVADLSLQEGFLYPSLSGAVLSGLFYFIYQISKGNWIGFGDVRLAVALGILLGTVVKAWLMVFFASTLGILVVLPSLISKKTKLSTKIPFGPLLILATIVVFLFGDSLIDAYSSIIGI